MIRRVQLNKICRSVLSTPSILFDYLGIHHRHGVMDYDHLDCIYCDVHCHSRQFKGVDQRDMIHCREPVYGLVLPHSPG